MVNLVKQNYQEAESYFLVLLRVINT